MTAPEPYGIIEREIASFLFDGYFPEGVAQALLRNSHHRSPEEAEAEQAATLLLDLMWWDWLNLGQISPRLSRTVVEVADGRRKLSVYTQPELWSALDKADSKTYNDRAILEAQLIKGSLKRKREGASPRSKPAPILVYGTPLEVARFYAKGTQLI